MSVDASYAEQLRNEATFAKLTIDSASVWGEIAITSFVISPLALVDDAQQEASRQAAFLAGPLVEDTHVVKGYRRDLLGRLIRIRGEGLGYDGNGRVCFVRGVRESDTVALTTLTVLSRL